MIRSQSVLLTPVIRGLLRQALVRPLRFVVATAATRFLRSYHSDSGSSISSGLSLGRSNVGIFSWNKHHSQITASALPSHLTPLHDLEPQLVAYFSSLEHHPHSSSSSSAAAAPSEGAHKSAAPDSLSSNAASSSGGSSAPPPRPPPPPPQTDPNSSSYTKQAVELSHAILSALNPHAEMSTGQRIRNIMLALLGVMAITSGVIYIFRDPLKGHLSEQTADVAKRSLTSTEVQLQVNALSSEVVRKLLNDPVIMSNCLSFLQILFASPETKQSLILLLQNTLKDPATVPLLSHLVSDLLHDLLNKPETLQQLTALLRKAITEPGNEQALQVLLNNFAQEERTQQILAQLARNVLNDPSVKSTAIQFVKEVTADSSLQQSTGDALWNAVKFSLRPNWLAKHPSPTGAPAQPTQVVIDTSNQTATVMADNNGTTGFVEPAITEVAPGTLIVASGPVVIDNEPRSEGAASENPNAEGVPASAASDQPPK